MINFHHLLSLLVCLACLSGATGAGKDCAVLHNQPNFQGSTYAITSRVQLPTIQDERIEDAYHNWNTKSISITNNCTLVACPDRYFRGKCQELNQSLSNVTSVNVAAVKCDCQEVIGTIYVKHFLNIWLLTVHKPLHRILFRTATHPMDLSERLHVQELT